MGYVLVRMSKVCIIIYFFFDKICFVFRIFVGIWRNIGVSFLKKIFLMLCVLVVILKNFDFVEVWYLLCFGC